MSKRVNPALIGFFILGALVLTVVGVGVLVPALRLGDRPMFVSYFEDSVNGLEVGAPVKFQGVPVGNVVNIDVRLDPREMASSAPVRYRIEIRRLQAAGAEFVDLQDEDVLRAHIEGGLRAQLQMESIVTGLLFVNLAYADDAEPVPPATYAERGVIPTKPSPFVDIEAEARELTSAARRVLDQTSEMLEAFEAHEIGVRLTAAARAIEGLAEAPEIRAALREVPGVAAQLTQTMAEIRLLTERVGTAVDPLGVQVDAVGAEALLALQSLRETIGLLPGAASTDAGLGYRMEEALISMTQAANAIRQLATSIEQDPSMLLRGRAPGP
jgi:paraquat-inducible protein B